MKELRLRGDIAAGGNGVQARHEAAREEAQRSTHRESGGKCEGGECSWMGHLGLAPGSHFVLRSSLTSAGAVLGAAG